VPADPRLDGIERAGLLILGMGLVLLLSSLVNSYAAVGKSVALSVTLACIFIGGFTYGMRHHLKQPAGVQNNGIKRASVTSRGALGWLIGVVFTGFYIVFYWWPEYLEGMVHLFDPLSEWMSGKPAGKYFMYTSFYSILVLIMGVKAMAKYRHSRYQMIRTGSIIFCQLVLAFILPYWMSALEDIEFYPTYFWPLAKDALWPDHVMYLMGHDHRAFAMFVLGWSIIMLVLVTPLLTYYYGKRWYCSWVCGCGGLANTMGDSWRHLSNKSLKAWKYERVTIYSVLVLVVVVTGMLWLRSSFGLFPEAAKVLAKWYGFFIGAIMSGVVGTGFYPLFGTRIWCRFACPMAAILGILQRYKSRFRITVNGAQCISCGNCSTYCEMGIDVKWYAQRGQDVVRASCVGCGMCSVVCPRGVLNLENGPADQRNLWKMDLLGDVKSRILTDITQECHEERRQNT